MSVLQLPFVIRRGLAARAVNACSVVGAVAWR